MRGYQLPAELGLVLAGVKVMAITGAYIYVWLLIYSPKHGPSWLFWLSYAIFAGATALLYSLFTGQPERQERQYLMSLIIDLAAIGYLFLLHAQAALLMLVGLVLICGFYAFVLPRTSALLVVGLSLTFYSMSLILGLLSASNSIDQKQFGALLIVGVAALTAVTWLVRKVKRGVDRIYSVTDELALDLSTQVIDSAISVDVLRERNQEVQTLLQIVQNIGSILEWDELFESIVVAFRNRFTFDKFCIYLYDAEKGTLCLRVESGSERASGSAKCVKPGDGIVGWVFSSAKGVQINDVRLDERYVLFNERGKRIRSLACEPLIYRGERLGVLTLDSEKVGSFDDKAFAFLESIAPLISNAVANSLSFTTVKTESHTDNLTGLNNHRGFMEKLLPLLEDSYRDDISLALLMMDIDNFKKVNDTYGHLVGNIILTDLADILREFFRGSDLVARYGGEEFVVVLNGTPAHIAPRMAEQLRRKVEAHQFPVSLERDTFKQVTISIGAASSADSNLQAEIIRGSRSRGEPDVYVRNLDDTAAKLIDNADQALYAAKREGKNVVMLSLQYPLPVAGGSVVRGDPDGEPD